MLTLAFKLIVVPDTIDTGSDTIDFTGGTGVTTPIDATNNLATFAIGPQLVQQTQLHLVVLLH